MQHASDSSSSSRWAHGSRNRRARPRWRRCGCLKFIFRRSHDGALGISYSLDFATSALEGTGWSIRVPALERKDRRVLHKYTYTSGEQATPALAGAVVDTACELDSSLEEGLCERTPLDESTDQLHALQAQLLELQLDMASMGSDLEIKEEELLSIKFEMAEQQLDVIYLGRALEEKAQDILNIQFEMVNLQSRPQAHLKPACEEAKAVQVTSRELAGKDKTVEAMGLLLSQAKELSEQLQNKVTKLGKELQRSHESYQALDQEHQAVVARHESERQCWMAELEQVRGKTLALPSTLDDHSERTSNGMLAGDE